MDFHSQLWGDFVGPHSEEIPDDKFEKFMSETDLRIALKQTGARLSKSEKAELLGLTEDELTKRESQRSVIKAPLTSYVDANVIAKGGLKRAAGYFDHLYQKADSLDEAFANASELVSDDANPDEWRLLAAARKASDVTAFLSVLTRIFARA